MGQGAITALTQIAAEALGFDMAQVALKWGDTLLPFAGPSVGSMGTRSIGSAVAEAGEAVRAALIGLAVKDRASPLHGLNAKAVIVRHGQLGTADGLSESVATLVSRQPEKCIERKATTGRTLGMSRLSRAAFGAQFAKVSIEPLTMTVHVERLVGAFACGRIINPLMVRSQLTGAMVWGIGQALMEASETDPRSGRWMNANLAEALVPTNADVRAIEVILIDEDDTASNPTGIKGVGELGLVGTAGAIANAIYHATGRRPTRLPIRREQLL
jgi:xanthine dehydrogenase YagR molybdenum-binding subunit